MAAKDEVAASISTVESGENEDGADSTGLNLSIENEVQENHPVQNEESNVSVSTIFVPELRVGLEFASKEAAFEYYKKYSYLHGFGVYSNGGSSADGKKQRVIYRCHKGRVSRSGKVKPVAEKKRVQEKTGCKANINLVFNPSKEMWFISSFINEHNHDLAPEFSHKIKSHRSMKFYVKKQLEINENAGLPTIGNINVVMQMGGGEDLCGFTERDARNVIGKIRRSGLKNGDAEAMMSFFRQSKAEDPDFYYACKFSAENRLEIVFWADSVSRAAYRYFGDAVSFDATYIVNKYDLPVAPIVGINHHYQTIVFGCSMMTTEDGDTYKWILQTFLDCMGGKAPSAIVTDQSQAMKVGIQHVLPNTIHRYCIWHIMSKLKEKIGHKEDAAKDISSVVWDSTTKEQFDSTWQDTITEYSLQDNVWLTDMFEIRAKWVPVYLSNFFWAGMSSTQRSESMNAFLDMFVNSKTCLSAFVKSFDSGLARLKRNELNEDYNCIRGDPKTFTEDPIEHQFSSLYTHKMFYKLQAELLGTIRLTYICSERLGVRRVYEVEEYGMSYSVHFNTENQSYKCDCHLFETDGIICRHGLLIFRVEKVQVAPDMYILKRWCKDRVYKRHHLDAKAIAVKINERRQAYDNAYMLLHSTFLELIDYALLDEPTLKAVADGLNALRSCIANSRERMVDGADNVGSNEASHSASNVMGLNDNENQAVVQDPLCKRRRGRNPAKRKQSVAEKKKIAKKKKLEEAEIKSGTEGPSSRVKTNWKFKKACFSNKRDTSTSETAN